MSLASFSKTDAAKRRDRYFQAATQAAHAWYDAEGNWISSSTPAVTRERYWLAVALYASGPADFADAVVRQGRVGYRESDESLVNFDIFHTNIAAVLLHHYRDKMAPDVRALIEERTREAFPMEPGDRRVDFQFHGYNDNMPSEATLGLIFGGQILGEKAAVEHGLWNLRQLASMLHRRGINSEWNSPTYSPLTLHCMAEIAEHAHHEEARELALKIEQRLWLDFAGRFHPEIGIVAPPYCRAYVADSLAHLSSLASLFWFALGDIARPSPMELFAPNCNGLVLHHENDLPFNIAQMCVFGTDAYHPPDAAVDLFHRKNYPFRAVATAEHGDGMPDYAATSARIETILEPDFAVGTSNIPWIGGEQCETYGVIYKRKKEVRSFQDVGVVYQKFLINDDEPGRLVFPTDGEGKTHSNAGEQFLNSRCGMVTVQSGPTVLAATHPQLSLGGVVDIKPPMPLTRLNEMITFPSHFGGADEVRIGGRALPSWSGEAKPGEWIGCRRGRLLIAIRPLVHSADFGPVKISLEKINNYEVIRSTFYQGPERIFTRPELGRMLGGFVAEHASVDDYPSLADFLHDLAGTKITHQYLTTRRIRYRRAAGKKIKPLELELSWSHGGIATRFATVNGKVPSVEPPVQIDGLKPHDFPLLDEWKSVPGYFPWPVLRAPCNKVDGIIVERDE